MKKFAAMFAFSVVMALGMSSAMAAETTVKGTMKCAKCSLKEADKCQATLVTADGAKYFITGAQAKAAHGEICKKDKENVSVTGEVAEKDGKKTIEASKIE